MLKKELHTNVQVIEINLSKDEWFRLGQWVQPTLSACFWNNWSQNNNKFPFEIEKLDGRILMIHGHTYVKKEDIEKIKFFLVSRENDFQLLKIFEDWIEKIHQSAKKKINLKLDSHVDHMENLKDCMNDIVNPWVFFILADEVIEPRLKQLSDNYGYDYAAIASLIHPSKDPIIVKQMKEAKLLHDEIKKLNVKELNIDAISEASPEIAEKIINHVKEYEFCGVHHFVGNPYTLESFFTHSVLVGTEESNSETEIPVELKWHILLLSIAAYGRTFMAETSDYVQLKVRPLLKEIEKKLNLEKNYHVWLSADEIIDILRKNINLPDIEPRKSKVSIIPVDGKEIILPEKETEILLKQMLDRVDKNISVLKGTIASKGKTVSTAKIVVSPHDIDKVKEGDILIAPETTPDFFSAMKRSSGIITERGGITSHAAIVSRELGIPCITAVINATVIIYDGQEIELDAEKGEIRIL